MKAWTPDTILELIEHYRTRPVLWDQSHPNAKKSELKHAAWLEIAEIMKRTDVEKKMNILVVQFRREIKRLRELTEKRESGEACKPLRSKWFAFDAMYFLKDKMRKHKRSNLPTKMSTRRDNEKRTESRSPECLTPFCAPSQNVIRKLGRPRKVKSYSEIPLEGLSPLETDQVANIETECDPHLPYEFKDEYSAFGDLVAIKIRKLPTASYKSRAMNTITNVLFQLESEFTDLESDGDAERYELSTVYVKSEIKDGAEVD